MGSSEENYERMWQMRQENEQRREELAQQQREREYLEEMGQPVEDPLTKWRREAAEQEQRFTQERRRRERSAQPAPVNWDLKIADAIAEERQFLIEVVGQAVGELREQIEENVRKEFEEQLRQARVDACEAKIRLAELRISFTELREHLSGGHGTTIDLPALPLRGSRAN